ncbi:hypothetical protein ACFXGI_10745 [Streptomyces sp. NPDC059355]|uniref:hypothetical protein n=1 Tax=Streptomyces sp. NPDC059355 TaxID=3346811 RepID=UPI0036952BFC
MIPVGTVDGGQIFAHPACTAATDITPAAPVLVIGPTLTEDGYQALRRYARTVADQVGAPATFASHDYYRTQDFGALYLAPLEWEADDFTPLVLLAEALAAGIPVHTPPADAGVCELCSVKLEVYVEPGRHGDILCGQCRYLDLSCHHCGEPADDDDFMDVVEAGETWWPVHAGCIDEGRRVHGPRAFVTE